LGEGGVATALSPSRIVRVIDGGLRAARRRVSGVPVIRSFAWPQKGNSSGQSKRLIHTDNRDFEVHHPPSHASSFKSMNEHRHSISDAIAACLMNGTSDIPPIICQ